MNEKHHFTPYSNCMWRNWAKNIEMYCPVFSPTDTDALLEIVQKKEFGLVARGYSFNQNNYGASPKFLVDLSSLENVVDVSVDGSKACVSPSTTLRQLAMRTHSENLQLYNYPSRLDFSVIGCIATGSHGTGQKASLCSAVEEFSILDFRTGDYILHRRGEKQFYTNLILPNRLGIITSLTLQLTRAQSYSRLTIGGVSFDDIPQILYFLSNKKAMFSIYLNILDEKRNSLIFTGQNDEVDGISERLLGDFNSLYFGRLQSRGLQVTRDDNYREIGLAHELIPHSVESLPVAGKELQSEYFFLKSDFEIVYWSLKFKLDISILKLLRSIEIRYLEQNDIFYSPSYGIDVIAIQFTWHNIPSEISNCVMHLENLLNMSLKGGFMRTHWGKLFSGSVKKWSGSFDQSAWLSP